MLHRPPAQALRIGVDSLKPLNQRIFCLRSHLIRSGRAINALKLGTEGTGSISRLVKLHAAVRQTVSSS